MKLQNFIVLFIIIILPIILVTSYYMSLQIDTINTQTSYNQKLLESTKSAIQAYEINTVQWNSNYNTVEQTRRRNVMAAINSFTTSFANGLGVGGASKDSILPYIPAVAFTLYDGYYIYSPAEIKLPIVDENEIGVKDEDGNLLYICKDSVTSDGTIPTYINGEQKIVSFTTDSSKAKTEYKHILKPFATYSKKYNLGKEEVIVNFTLDNYVKIYGYIGEDNNKYVEKEGYLDDRITINTSTSRTINGIKYNNIDVTGEVLTENIRYYENNEKYQEKAITEGNNVTYVYAFSSSEKNRKVYNVGTEWFTLSAENIKESILDEAAADGTITNPRTSRYYKKCLIPIYNDSKWSYKEVYQDLSDRDKKWYEKNNPDEPFSESNKNEITNIPIISNYLGNTYINNLDYSAVNYCVGAYIFTSWAKGLNIEESGQNIFYNTQDKNSRFNQERRDVIKNTLSDNLYQAITSYSRNSENQYVMPKLSETDWDQILTNASIITFAQNIPIGMKYFNNYVVATSTQNKEYVDPNEIYLQSDSDTYYHKPHINNGEIEFCDKLTENNIVGYRNIDYVAKSYIKKEGATEKTEYYYLHANNDKVTQSCYYCLIQRDLFSKAESIDLQKTAYYTALARERYVAKIMKLPKEANEGGGEIPVEEKVKVTVNVYKEGTATLVTGAKITINGSTYNQNSKELYVEKGSTVTATAIAPEGYNTISTSTYQDNINEDITIDLYLQITMVNIQVFVKENSILGEDVEGVTVNSTIIKPDGTTYYEENKKEFSVQEGSTVTATAIPPEGYTESTFTTRTIENVKTDKSIILVLTKNIVPIDPSDDELELLPTRFTTTTTGVGSPKSSWASGTDEASIKYEDNSNLVGNIGKNKLQATIYFDYLSLGTVKNVELHIIYKIEGHLNITATLRRNYK